MNKTNKIFYIYQNTLSQTIWTMNVPPLANKSAKSFEFLASVYARDIQEASIFADSLYK